MVDRVAALTNLEALSLLGTDVTSLASLVGLKNLRWLDCSGTQVSEFFERRNTLCKLSNGLQAGAHLRPRDHSGLAHLSATKGNPFCWQSVSRW